MAETGQPRALLLDLAGTTLQTSNPRLGTRDSGLGTRDWTLDFGLWTLDFHETQLSGAFVIEIERLADERGFFARTWCRDELRRRGLNGGLAQCSVSFNRQKGTLRGMHYQAAPHEETKVVRCTRGGLCDVIIDLRPDSPTFRQWVGVELTADNHRMLYVPAGFAHGFQTLADETEVFYQISKAHAPGAARGVRWDDPAFGIRWPLPVSSISPRDLAFPSWNPGLEAGPG
jgi:dTDP-4-dehydrorhamnose 3,5-epimerase